MRLLLIHGRFDPLEQLEEWGFNGLDIEGMEALYVTYNTHYVLWFKDQEAFTTARSLTGWEVWDDLALLMDFHDDMLKIVPIA